MTIKRKSIGYYVSRGKCNKAYKLQNPKTKKYSGNRVNSSNRKLRKGTHVFKTKELCIKFLKRMLKKVVKKVDKKVDKKVVNKNKSKINKFGADKRSRSSSDDDDDEDEEYDPRTGAGPSRHRSRYEPEIRVPERGVYSGTNNEGFYLIDEDTIEEQINIILNDPSAREGDIIITTPSNQEGQEKWILTSNVTQSPSDITASHLPLYARRVDLDYGSAYLDYDDDGEFTFGKRHIINYYYKGYKVQKDKSGKRFIRKNYKKIYLPKGVRTSKDKNPKDKNLKKNKSKSNKFGSRLEYNPKFVQLSKTLNRNNVTQKRLCDYCISQMTSEQLIALANSLNNDKKKS